MEHDTNYDANLYRAYLNARYCMEYLLTAHAMKMESGRHSTHYVEASAEAFEKMADYFGYDLVKREEKREAA
jgi:hypothetical protein